MKKILKFSVMAIAFILLSLAVDKPKSNAEVNPPRTKYCKFVNFDIGCMCIWESRTQCSDCPGGCDQVE
jgi:hypothetical protein